MVVGLSRYFTEKLRNSMIKTKNILGRVSIGKHGLDERILKYNPRHIFFLLLHQLTVFDVKRGNYNV